MTGHLWNKALPLAGALLLAFPAVVIAQLRGDTARISPVVVTATKTESPAAARVASTTVLDVADLRSRGVATVAEAMREVAGVTVVQAGGSGAQTALFMRGGQSNYVKVLVDGVPVNEAGGYIDWANLTLDNIERIEVVRGPSSVLHGSDAVVGAIQLFTRVREQRPTIRAETRLRIQERQLGRFDTAPLEKKRSHGRDVLVEGGGGTARLSFTGSLARTSDDGSLAFNNEHRNNSASFGMRATIDSATTLRLTTRYNDATFNYPTDFTGAATDSNAHRDERRTVVSAQLDRRVSRRTSFALLAGINRMRDNSSNLPDSPGDSVDLYSVVTGARQRETAEGRLNVMVTPRSMLTFGADFHRQSERSDGWSRFASFPADTTRFDERRNNSGAFVQLLGEGDQGSLYQLGARIDDNAKFGRFTTWRGSIGFPVYGAFWLRGSFGTAFKEPAFHEVFPTAFSRGNAELLPERSTAWEVAIHRDFNAGRLTVAWFDQRFRDMIQWNPGAAAPDPDYANVARAVSRGYEVELRTVERAGVRGWIGFSGARTRVTDSGIHEGEGATFVEGQPLLRRPRTTVTAGGSWRAPGGTRISAALNHVGPRPDRNFAAFPAEPVELDAYTRFDVAADFPIATGGAPLSLLVRADNVTNTRVEPVYGYIAPGRVLSVGVRTVLR